MEHQDVVAGVERAIAHKVKSIWLRGCELNINKAIKEVAELAVKEMIDQGIYHPSDHGV